ncbi:MAG: hypothetical protein ABIE55_02195 [Candidatus Aenigmatarchaeota archaeon]
MIEEARMLHEKTGNDVYRTTITSETRIERIINSLESMTGVNISTRKVRRNVHDIVIDFCGVNNDADFSKKQEEIYKILEEEKAEEISMRKYRAK